MGKAQAPIPGGRARFTRLPKLVAQPTAEQLRRFVEERIGHAELNSRETTMAEEYERLRKRRAPRPDSPERYVAAVRHRTSLADTPESTLKRCTQCRRVAVRGLDVCYFHGGAKTVHDRRRALGIQPKVRWRQIGRALRDVMRQQAFPAELMAQPVFITLYDGIRSPKLRYIASPLMREVVLAWYAREDGNYEPWATAMLHCRQHGFL